MSQDSEKVGDSALSLSSGKRPHRAASSAQGSPAVLGVPISLEGRTSVGCIELMGAQVTWLGLTSLPLPRAAGKLHPAGFAEGSPRQHLAKSCPGHQAVLRVLEELVSPEFGRGWRRLLESDAGQLSSSCVEHPLDPVSPKQICPQPCQGQRLCQMESLPSICRGSEYLFGILQGRARNKPTSV